MAQYGGGQRGAQPWARGKNGRELHWLLLSDSPLEPTAITGFQPSASLFAGAEGRGRTSGAAEPWARPDVGSGPTLGTATGDSTRPMQPSISTRSEERRVGKGGESRGGRYR